MIEVFQINSLQDNNVVLKFRKFILCYSFMYKTVQSVLQRWKQNETIEFKWQRQIDKSKQSCWKVPTNPDDDR